MEYVDGRTLRDLLRDDRRLLPERALEITDGMLRALDYSHHNGIVHRDIKPANVMLTRTGEVKVVNFGTAGVVSGHGAQVIGTQYLSPEQVRGERVDARSDLYSTGCVLYELLTGRLPFLGDSPVAIAYQHMRQSPVPPSQLDPEIPAWADSIVLKAMAKDPAQRYQSAAEMRTDVQRALAALRGVGPRRAVIATRVSSQTPQALSSLISQPSRKVDLSGCALVGVTNEQQVEKFLWEQRKRYRNSSGSTVTRELSVTNSITLTVTTESSKLTSYNAEAGVTLLGFASIKGQVQRQLSERYSITRQSTSSVSDKTAVTLKPHMTVEHVIQWKAVTWIGTALLGRPTRGSSLPIAAVPYQAQVSLTYDDDVIDVKAP